MLLASSITPADDMVARSFCDAPPHDRVCSVAPKDNTDFDASFRFLTNVTLETYDQYTHGGTCMGCHARAITLAGQDANFSFFPSKAR